MREIHTDLKGREREVLIPVASFTPTDIAELQVLLGYLGRAPAMKDERRTAFVKIVNRLIKLYEAEVGRVIDASHP